MTDSRKTTLPVDGMSCSHCVQRVKDALESVDGVIAADVDLDAGGAIITHNGTVSRTQLADAVAEAGYEVPTEA